jgi:hypothetical protein
MGPQQHLVSLCHLGLYHRSKCYCNGTTYRCWTQRTANSSCLAAHLTHPGARFRLTSGLHCLHQGPDSSPAHPSQIALTAALVLLSSEPHRQASSAHDRAIKNSHPLGSCDSNHAAIWCTLLPFVHTQSTNVQIDYPTKECVALHKIELSPQSWVNNYNCDAYRGATIGAQ